MSEMGWFERKKSAPSANGFCTIKHQRIIWFIAEKYICLVKVSAIPTFILVCNYLMLFCAYWKQIGIICLYVTVLLCSKVNEVLE